MLRAAAVDAGVGATGVVLTGLLDDGAAGLSAVRRYGGACLVQDPEHAEYPCIPRAALAAVPGARCLSLVDLSAALVRRVLHSQVVAVDRPVPAAGP